MYLLDNPVLQRELLVNLRMKRAFVLLFLYQALLAAVVYFAWPRESRLDLTTNPEAPRRLVDLFFLGQYILASMMTPSFAASTITGEKERKIDRRSWGRKHDDRNPVELHHDDAFDVV